MNAAQSIVNDFLHLFFPQVCVGCGSDILSSDHQLCLQCIEGLPGTNFFDQPGNPIEKIFYGRLKVAHAASGYFFTKESLIESLVYELKYKSNPAIGELMGKRLGGFLLNSRFNNVDIIIPLPLNAQRLKKEVITRLKF